MKGVLDKWEASQPSPALDQRVWTSYRRIKNRRWMWTPACVAAALIVAIASWQRTSARENEIDSQVISTPSDVTVETRLDATGFQPLRDAKLAKGDR